ncbi:hypothetical protein PAXINDRAFT_103314 [Paxillus involutus ATCC 200175]|uniref:Nephrocystin 3-like N-terminal domain-containing protein n=1 Tax=Paxillus involutus ATCC 200175 TaxID=664439 RepID=A0A0C9T5H0_PAXIN|nr:hypothetical protein PAXINDRAFT_103314 [Paxillus involutus ATCC 200175]
MEQEHLRNTSDVSMQFTELLLAPSQKMSTSRPILVVIDALNNCGNETSRVLEMLANRSMELPNNFRVLVTARPETDIVHAFQDKEHVLIKTIKNLHGGAAVSRSQTTDSPTADSGKPSLPPPHADALSSTPESPGDKHYAPNLDRQGDQPHPVPARSPPVTLASYDMSAQCKPEVLHERIYYGDSDAHLETNPDTMLPRNAKAHGQTPLMTLTRMEVVTYYG